MRDFTHRGKFVSTYWKETGKAPKPPEWSLFGIGLNDGQDVLLGRGKDISSCLVAAQKKLAEEFPGRFI